MASEDVGPVAFGESKLAVTHSRQLWPFVIHWPRQAAGLIHHFLTDDRHVKR